MNSLVETMETLDSSGVLSFMMYLLVMYVISDIFLSMWTRFSNILTQLFPRSGQQLQTFESLDDANAFLKASPVTAIQFTQSFIPATPEKTITVITLLYTVQ